MSRRWASAVLVSLTACQPGEIGQAPEQCFPEPPPPGEVYVGPIGCSDMFIGGGEQRGDDFWLANANFRAVIRHPENALTLQGASGGTIVDAAPWDASDRLHEIAPIVADGWLDIVEFDVEEDGIRLAGHVVSLPDRPSPSVGEWREVRWRITPDEPWLVAEGADGFWIHANGDYSIWDGQIWAGQAVYGHDSTAPIDDLGGAIRVSETNRLMIASRTEALTARADELQKIVGEEPQATNLGLYRGDIRVGVVSLTNGQWDQLVDARIDGIRAEGQGRPSSPVVPPGQPTPLGPTGSIHVKPAWISTPRPFILRWSDLAGRSGQTNLSPDGGTLNIGAGQFTLNVSGGPNLWETVHTVVVPNGETVEVGITPSPRFDPGNHLLALTGWPSDRDRTFRNSNTSVIRTREARGADWIALTPLAEVSQADQGIVNAPILPVRNGTLAAGPDDAWHIWSWGWGANNQRAGHGAPDTTGRDAMDSLAVVQGGSAGPRKTAVDLGWLRAAGDPWMAPNRPDFVRLDAPVDGELRDWQPWFDWLDARLNLIAIGETTWVPVPDPTLYGDIDIIQGLRRGTACATSGPLLSLTWRGLQGGQVSPDDASRFAIDRAQITLLGGGDLTHVALVGGGGTVYGQWTPDGEDWSQEVYDVAPEGWLIAVGWNDAGTEFAATSPIWIQSP